jgi:hypothetical protein
MECELRFPSTGNFEMIWLRGLALPVLLAFYTAALCVVLGRVTGLFAAETGMGLVASLALEGHLAAAIFLTAQALVGNCVLQRLGWTHRDTPQLERILFAVVAGFVLSDAVLMLFAVFDVLNPLVVSITLLLATAASAWGTPAPLFRLRRDKREDLPMDAVPTMAVWGSGLIVLLGAGYWLWPLLVQTALPNSDWDSALYHLPLAERYLAGMVWNSDPLFSANSFPGGVSLHYAALMVIGFESAVIPYNFLFVLLNLAAAYALGSRLGDKRTGAWAVLIASGIHVLWQQGVDPRIDGFLSFFIAMAMLGFVGWLRASAKPNALYLTAVALGAAIGAKYTGLFIAFSFAAAIGLWTLWQRRSRSDGPSLRALAMCVALVLVPNGIWYASNVALHGDPMFPMLRGDYYEDASRPGERIAMTGALDEYVAALPAYAPERQRALALEGMFKAEAPSNLFNLVDVHKRPRAYATKPNHFASPLLLLFALLPFCLAKERDKRLGAVFLWSLATVCFVGLGSQTNLLRYVLPMLVLFAVASGVVIDRIRHPAWQVFWLFCGISVLASHHPAETLQLKRLQPELYASSGANPLAWLERVGYNYTPAMPIVVARINREIETGAIAPSSLILMAGEGKGRLLQCDFLPDLSWFLQRWTVELARADHAQDRVARSLREQGVTHILYNPAYFRWVLTNTKIPVPPLAVAMEQIETFMRDRGKPVFDLAGMRLVEISYAASEQ